ncbi:MAG: prephenate dehydrogenase/arogenate dehydrogenase family protein, partial [Lachnospiraceae bacterium]|nr:prephenate dehydrogenase/arogenate dehydrogenase family protein [Lachnospiraceae bacterium]
GHTVCAFDTDKTVLSFAMLSNAVQEELTDDNLKDCDIILICVYPEAALRFMKEKGPLFGEKPVVIDCCGTKRNIVDKGRELAKKYGFTYVGGHPMAGTQFSGFKYAKDDLYFGAPMVLIPEKNDDIVFLDKLTQLLSPAGFARFTVTTPEKHDRVIAFTSQLAHVVSNAYVKSPSAKIHSGLSADSYRDLTRVAWLNPEMWTQLFLDNDDDLIDEIDILIGNLQAYRDAIAGRDRETLIRLLDEGRRIKEETDRL